MIRHVLPTGLLIAGTALAQPAFPGAEGFGAVATGGRGGRVIPVTTLAPTGPGSLQAALDAEGPRTVIFRVSGLIDGPIHLTRGDVTIAGETSPGGITIRQLHTTEVPFCDQDTDCLARARRAENWIVRHLRIRPAGAFDDGLRLRATRRVLIDHVSIAGALDEAVEISYSNQITIQHSIFAETLGEHAPYGGVLLNYASFTHGLGLTQISLHHNLWHRIQGRFPEVSCESPDCAGQRIDLELSNNLLWDQGYFIDIHNTTISASDEGRPFFVALNWVGNVSQPRPGEATSYGVIHIAAPKGPQTRTWFHDNRSLLYPTRRDYDLMYCCNDFATHTPTGERPTFAQSERHPFPPIRYTPAADLPAAIVARVGAFPRDPLDQRLLRDVATRRIDPTPRDRNPAGDGLALPPGPWPDPPTDTDADGLPDTWERTHGLDPTRPDAHEKGLSQKLWGIEGLTHLECYLAELARAREAAKTP